MLDKHALRETEFSQITHANHTQRLLHMYIHIAWLTPQQKKKTNISFQHNAMHCDTIQRLNYLTCTDIQQTLSPDIVSKNSTCIPELISYPVHITGNHIHHVDMNLQTQLLSVHATAWRLRQKPIHEPNMIIALKATSPLESFHCRIA